MSDSPFTRRESKSHIGRTGRRSEERLSDRIGARLTPASGATAHSKADMTLGELLIEAKSTIHRSLVLKLDWLIKLKMEAMAVGKEGVLVVAFTDSKGKPDSEWVVLPLERFMEMRDEILQQTSP